MRIQSCIAIIVATLSPAASADITAQFVESAPKDRFIFANTGNCALDAVTLELDLSQSTAGLIFDTTDQGAGVEVFQPFEFVRGADLVTSRSDITDGTSTLILNVTEFPIGAQIAFTLDVDDTLKASDLGQIRVSGSEIEGAELRAAGKVAVFGSDAKANLGLPDCT